MAENPKHNRFKYLSVQKDKDEKLNGAFYAD
jgi:hypothetical protein